MQHADLEAADQGHNYLKDDTLTLRVSIQVLVSASNGWKQSRPCLPGNYQRCVCALCLEHRRCPLWETAVVHATVLPEYSCE